MNYIADRKFNGTLQRSIALVIDDNVIGGTLTKPGGWDAVVDRIAASVVQHDWDAMKAIRIALQSDAAEWSKLAAIERIVRR